MLISKPHGILISADNNCCVLLAFTKHFAVVRKIGRDTPPKLYGCLFDPPIRDAKYDRHSVRAKTANDPYIQITITDAIPFSTAIGASALLLGIDINKFQFIRGNLGNRTEMRSFAKQFQAEFFQITSVHEKETRILRAACRRLCIQYKQGW